MARILSLCLALIITWLLWSGHYTPFLLALGGISVALTLWLSVRMGLIDRATVPIQMGLGAITYWAWLIKEIAVANWIVMRTVLSPSMRVDPVYLKLRSRAKSTLARVTYGNSITLTPGTYTMDMDEDILIVHALSDPGQQGFDEMDARCERFDR